MTAKYQAAIFFEDIVVGREQQSDWFLIERGEVIDFAARWDPYPHHLDDESAANSIFGRIAACAPHIFAISARLSHDLPGPLALMAGLGGDGLQLAAPVYAGTRVRLTRRFTAARESKSRPNAGIVSLEDRLEDPEGLILFRTSGSILLEKRGADAPPTARP